MKNAILKTMIACIFTTITVPMFCMEVMPHATRTNPITHQEYTELFLLYNEALALRTAANERLTILNDLEEEYDNTENLSVKAGHAAVSFEHAIDCYNAQNTDAQRTVSVSGDKELCITAFLDFKMKAMTNLLAARQIAALLNITIAPNCQPTQAVEDQEGVVLAAPLPAQHPVAIIAPVQALAAQHVIAPAATARHYNFSSLVAKARTMTLQNKTQIILGSKICAGLVAAYSICKGISYCTNHPGLLLVLTAISFADQIR